MTDTAFSEADMDFILTWADRTVGREVKGNSVPLLLRAAEYAIEAGPGALFTDTLEGFARFLEVSEETARNALIRCLKHRLLMVILSDGEMVSCRLSAEMSHQLYPFLVKMAAARAAQNELDKRGAVVH